MYGIHSDSVRVKLSSKCILHPPPLTYATAAASLLFAGVGCMEEGLNGRATHH